MGKKPIRLEIMWNSLHRFWLFDDPRSYGARAILREAAVGLQMLGKQVRCCPFDPSQPDSPAFLRQDIEEFQPDAILLANHPASLFCRQVGFPDPPAQMLVWLLDDPFLMGGEPFSADELVLAADPGFIAPARARGAHRILFLPVAAPVHAHAIYKEEYAFPLVYVGAASDLQPLRRQLQPPVADYLDRIVQHKLSRPYAEFQNLLAETPFAAGKQLTFTGQLAYYLYAESNRRSRLQFLQPLASLGLRLFGNPLWSKFIDGTPLHPLFCGSIDPLEEYPHLIRSTRINLNLRSLQGFITPTQRDFWVPRYGGFLLSTQHQKPLPDWRKHDPQNYFRLNEFPWSPVAATPEELAKAADFWLYHPAERQNWILHAAAELQQHHTFTHRMNQLGMILDSFS
jgi:hypothetical protein